MAFISVPPFLAFAYDQGSAAQIASGTQAGGLRSFVTPQRLRAST